MRTAALFLTILSAGVACGAVAQDQALIKVSFAIDGKPATCTDFTVGLQLNGEVIKPKHSNNSFEVPTAFEKPAKRWSDNQFVDISLSCAGHTFIFPKRHPAFIRPGDWQLGIAYPVYAMTHYGYTHEFDRGAWLGYLIFEGEPGVVTFAPQPDAPPGMAESLRVEQKKASGGRAKEIAYTLAVFNIEYAKNRDYLLSLLNSCLSRPKESPENDECDRELVDFVTNLYWRGDESLLSPLLLIADTRRDVIGGIGMFYANLLARRCAPTLAAMDKIPTEKQQLITALLDGPSSNTAKQCAARLTASPR